MPVVFFAAAPEVVPVGLTLLKAAKLLKAAGAILVSAQTVSNAVRDLCDRETAGK